MTRLVPMTASLRPTLESIISYQAFLHRHMDWRSPQDWIGNMPYWLLVSSINSGVVEKENNITRVINDGLAILACPPDPAKIAWIRLFACIPTKITPLESWSLLWKTTNLQLLDMDVEVAAAVALNMPWFEEVLHWSNFIHTHDMVCFGWDHPYLPNYHPHNIRIRKMTKDDLLAVQAIDECAFPSLWRYSIKTLNLAFAGAAVASVAVNQDGEILGYQISNHSTETIGHLSRLAVHPNLQGRGIGSTLVTHLLEWFMLRGVFCITVNTQSNNIASQKIYERLGFVRQKPTYPVYELRFKERCA